jgi:pyridoxine/pyridoxamine 5'-phosphate oxidase
MKKGQDVMVRSYAAGVFAGKFVSEKVTVAGKEVTLKKARRMWYWSGAASLSQLATQGTSNPSNCKFPVEVADVNLMNVVEIIPITKEARKSIDAVPVWSA